MFAMKPRLQAQSPDAPQGAQGPSNKLPLLLVAVVVIVAGVLVLSRKSGSPSGAAGRESDTGAAQTGAVELSLWDSEEVENTVVLDEWLKRFQAAHPEIRVSRQTYPAEDLRTKFVTAATAGQASDIVWGPNDIAGVFHTAKLIQPADAFTDLSRFVPAVREAVRLGGKEMGVPMTFGNALILLYNKTILQMPPATTGELISMGKAHTDPAQGRYGLAYFQNEPFWLSPFIGGFGGWPLSVDPASGKAAITLDNPGTVAALEFVRALKAEHKIVPQECDYDCAKGLFLEGKAAMHINGDWSVMDYNRRMGTALGIAPLPVVDATGKPMVPMVSGRYLFVNAQLPESKRAAVTALAAYLTSLEVQTEVVQKMVRVPVTIEAQESEALKSSPVVQDLLRAAANGRPMPAQVEMRAAWDAMRPMLQRVMAGTTSPADAAKLMQDSAAEKLAALKH